MPYLPNRLNIDPSVFIAPGAVVVGEVSVGSRSSVWYHATLRGDMAPVRVGVESTILHNAKEYVEYARRYREGQLG